MGRRRKRIKMAVAGPTTPRQWGEVEQNLQRYVNHVVWNGP
jgi:hypothetical protein